MRNLQGLIYGFEKHLPGGKIDIGQASVHGLSSEGTTKQAVELADVPDNRRQIIGGRRPMICGLPADYKESANFKGHGLTPASGRCPADLYTIGCRLMSPNIRLARFPIFEVCNRHARSQVARLCMIIFIFSANLTSNHRCYPWNLGDRATNF